jgi:hypothetical protein
MQFYLGRLEALLARHWPEALQDIDVWRNKTPLALLAHYPGPQDMLEHAADVLQNVHELGHGNLRTTQAQRMLGCAQRSVGVALDDEAKRLIQLTATEALRMRTALDDVDDRIEHAAQQQDATRHIATTVGKVTSVVLIAHLGPLTDYMSTAALEKACGLNLKIRSSGNYLGRLSITKRGSPIVQALPVPRLAAAHQRRPSHRRLVSRTCRLSRWAQARRHRRCHAKADSCALACSPRHAIRLQQVDRRTRTALQSRFFIPTDFARRSGPTRADRRALIPSLSFARFLVRVARGFEARMLPEPHRSSRIRSIKRRPSAAAMIMQTGTRKTKRVRNHFARREQITA